MDKFIRQLTHDDTELEQQWSQHFNRLYQESINIPSDERSMYNIRVIEALIEYIQADREEHHENKCQYIRLIIEQSLEPLEVSLVDLIRLFCHAFNLSSITNPLNLILLETFYSKFRLGEQLSKHTSTNLIVNLFQSFQQQTFDDEHCPTNLKYRWTQLMARTIFSQIDTDKNKLNHSSIMQENRAGFQQFYR
jgi:hypothetical protein